MTSFSTRGLAVLGVAALALAAPGSALAATAHAKKPARTTKATTKPAPVRFAAVGTLASASADSIVLTVKGTSKNVRATSLTISVPATAKVTRNDVVVTLADLLVGDHVAVAGTKGTTGVLTAQLVNAEGPVVVEPTPAPTDPAAPVV